MPLKNRAKIKITPKTEKEMTAFMSFHDNHGTKLTLTFLDTRIFVATLLVQSIKQDLSIYMENN